MYCGSFAVKLSLTETPCKDIFPGIVFIPTLNGQSNAFFCVLLYKIRLQKANTKTQSSYPLYIRHNHPSVKQKSIHFNDYCWFNPTKGPKPEVFYLQRVEICTLKRRSLCFICYNEKYKKLGDLCICVRCDRARPPYTAQPGVTTFHDHTPTIHIKTDARLHSKACKKKSKQ